MAATVRASWFDAQPQPGIHRCGLVEHLDCDDPVESGIAGAR